MGDGSLLAGRGIVPGQVAEIIVALDGEPGQRGSGYRVGPTSVLTVAHVVEGAVAVRVRFDADLPGEWITEVISCWADPRSDLAVLTIAPREGEPAVAVARFGRIGGDRAAVLAAQAVGFPRFKLKTDNVVQLQYRDSHQADGSVAVLSNRRERTLEVTVPPPERDPDPDVSPWEGLSGAAVWIGGRIVGVIAKHHRCDGLGRLAAARLDLALAGLDQGRRAELRTLLDLPDVLPDVALPSVSEFENDEQVQHVFISYVREDTSSVDRLARALRDCGVEVWLDRDQIKPGVRWAEAIRTAIRDGSFYLACFSTSYASRKSSYMNEELTLAVEELRMRRFDQVWFIPILLDDGKIPDIPISSGETLRSLQWVSLREDWDVGIRAILATVSPGAEKMHSIRVDADRARSDSTMTDKGGDANIPANLPAVWAMLGQLPRAEALAHSIPDSDSRAKALGYLAEIVAAGGDPDRAEELIAQITNPDSRAEMLCQLLKVVAIGRNPDWLGRLSKVVATSGDPDRAARLANEAEALIAQTTNPDRRAELVIQLAKSAITIGDPDRAARLANEAEALIAQITNPESRTEPLNRLAKIVAACGDLDWAEALIAQITDPALRAELLIQLARAVIASGDPGRVVQLANEAEELIAQITNPESRTEPLNLLAKVVAACGDLDWAEALIARITDPFGQRMMLGWRMEAAVASGDLDRAEALIAQIADPDSRAKLLSQLAEAVAASGDLDRAETLIAQVTDPDWRAMALDSLAEAAVASGDLDRAEALIAQITDPDSRAMALDSLAEAAVASGDLDRAEALIAQVTDPDWRAELLSQLAGEAATNGDLDRAEALSAQTTSPDLRAEQLSKLADEAAARDDHEALIAQITPLSWRAAKLSAFAETVAFDDPDRAARLAGEAEALIAQITSPDLRARQ